MINKKDILKRILFKGRLILSSCEFFPKMNSFLLVCDVFLFVFWMKLKTFRDYLTFTITNLFRAIVIF